jgi:hypothetical protein
LHAALENFHLVLKLPSMLLRMLADCHCDFSISASEGGTSIEISRSYGEHTVAEESPMKGKDKDSNVETNYRSIHIAS